MTIPDEAVEAVARALWELRASASYPEWPNVDLGLREEYRKDARAALTAAEPYIRAQVAAEIRADRDTEGCGENDYCHGWQTANRTAARLAEGNGA